MIQIRPFSPSDMPSIMAVVSRSLGESYPPSLYLTVSNLWREGFLVIVEEAGIVGFVATVPSGPGTARVLMLAVLPEYRKRSYGKRLMGELYSRCIEKGFDTVVLEVRKSNREAISFYEGQGFVLFGDIKNFYTNGEDAYKMMKVLQS